MGCLCITKLLFKAVSEALSTLALAQTTTFHPLESDEGLSSEGHAYEGGFRLIALSWQDITPWWHSITAK